MGSVGVLIVWACECWAFIRFKKCLADENIQRAINDVPLVRRWIRHQDPARDGYPYRAHGQPLMAWGALLGCLAILVVANGAPLWKLFTAGYFFGAYLAPICFLVLWAMLKILRRRPWTLKELKKMWQLVDLTDGVTVRNKFLALHEMRVKSTTEETETQSGGLLGHLQALVPSRFTGRQR